MESLAVVFGRRLRAIRKERGLTQEELGQASKVDFKHIGSIERGIHPPSFAAVESFARALNVPYHELFLPEHLATADLERQARSLVEGRELDAASVKQFFATLADAISKLQTGRTTKP